MEKLIRQIVQEELRRALLEISEPFTRHRSNDEILYNFEDGKAFGVNKLARDIEGLEQYYMSSYFPNSEMKESWMFEIETHFGGSQIIEIIHMIDSSYDSYWKLNIAEADRGSDQPQIVKSSDPIKGYENFIQIVNSSLGKMINPDYL